MKEKAFENKIKNYLKSKGVYFVKFFANSYTRVGVPDLLACVMVGLLELKLRQKMANRASYN